MKKTMGNSLGRLGLGLGPWASGVGLLGFYSRLGFDNKQIVVLCRSFQNQLAFQADPNENHISHCGGIFVFI